MSVIIIFPLYNPVITVPSNICIVISKFAVIGLNSAVSAEVNNSTYLSNSESYVNFLDKSSLPHEKSTSLIVSDVTPSIVTFVWEVSP